MTNVVENKAPNQLDARQKLEQDQVDDGKLFSFDEDKTPPNKPTMTTQTSNETTLAAVATATIQYDVEHLATFSTATSHEQDESDAVAPTKTTIDNARDKSSKFKLKQATPANGEQTPANVTEPREALQRLFELEKLSGIWTQRMQIGLEHEFMLIVDCETNSIVERFHRDRVTKPEAFNHYNDIYNNIIVFNIDQQHNQDLHQDEHHHQEQQRQRNDEDCDKTPGELHIFQCVSHKAKQLVADILSWKSSSLSSSSSSSNLEPDKTQAAGQTEQENNNSAQDDNLSSESAASKEMPINKRSSRDESKELSKEAMRELNSEDSNQMAPTTTSATDNAANKPAVMVSSSAFKSNETEPIVNVNVKETVQVFNQIAALREKSGQQTARPLSDASSSSQSANSQQTTTSSEFSRAPLGPNGQPYKQRSIRATLAPKVASDARNESAAKSGLHNNQKRSTTSSSSSNVSSSAAGPTGGHSSKLVASSQSDHHHHHQNLQHSSNRNPSLGPTSEATATTTTTTGHHDGKSLQKHTASHNGNHTQAGLSGQHNHDHNHQHQHNHRQAPLVKGKSSTTATTTTTNGNKSSRLPATNGHHHQNHDVSPGPLTSSNSSGRSGRTSSPLQQQQAPLLAPDEQVTSNESYVSVLNHCFDDIEKFILRIQHAYAAMRDLQAKRRHTKRSTAAASQLHHKSHHPNGPLPPLPSSLSASELARLVAQAQGPSADDYFEILSKFKLAFNLLAKLKGCIHEPNAPELVHFLFTPLAIIIKSARNLTPPVDPTVVGIPYLNRDALELLSNCCTSKESDLWFSLGPNWTETIDAQLLKASRLPNSFQPIFSDGWAPVISELELIGLVAPQNLSPNGPNVDGRRLMSGGHLLRMDGTASGHAGAHLPPPPLPPAPSSSSSANKQTIKTKQTSPSSRYAEPTFQTGYRTDQQQQQQQQQQLEEAAAELIEAGPQPLVDLPADSYRVLDSSHHYQHKPISRHSMPGDRLPKRSGAKQHQGNRRNSEYIGQYAPPMGLLNGNSVAPYEPDDLNGRYAAGYSTNPSNDYTELQIDNLQNGQQYLAPSGSSHRAHNHHGDLQQLATGQGNRAAAARRKGSKSSYNRRYLDADSRYDNDHDDDDGADQVHRHHGGAHEMMVHEAEREAMLMDMGPAQTEWFYELKLRGALIVRVLFTREANNDKELTVKRGEILEILDDTRKWWKARNIDLQVAYVPHTIVALMEHYQTLDELLTGSSNSGDMIMMINDDQIASVDSQRFVYRDHNGELQNQYYGFREPSRNSKTAKGAFRYF